MCTDINKYTVIFENVFFWVIQSLIYKNVEY